MRVYHPQGRVKHTLYVSPASDPRSAAGSIDSDWLQEDGSPKLIEVHFIGGGATVPDSLGRYLCATKQAKRTRLILPSFSLAAA